MSVQMKTFSFVVEVKRAGSPQWEMTDPITIDAPNLTLAHAKLRAFRFADLRKMRGNKGNVYRSPTYVVLENEAPVVTLS